MNELLSELSGLFKIGEGPEFGAATTTPITGGSEWQFDLSIPSDLTFFEGHFPGHAVFPGVVQIDWAAKIARHLFGGMGKFQKMSNVKFVSMIFPKMKLTLQLAVNEDKKQVKFSYFVDEVNFSSGILVYSQS